MKTPTPIVATSILAGLFLASCQSPTPTEAPPSVTEARTAPFPSWTKSTGSRANSRKVKFTSKLIEITRQSNSPDLPSRLSQKKLSSKEFQIFVRKMSQRKGADILTSPTATAFEGQLATIEVTRDFIHPDPAQSSKLIKDKTGVTQFFRARSYDGGKTYRLNVLTEVKEFIRFQKLTNSTEQPIFQTRRLGDTVTLAAGQTILFSGLVSEKQQSVEDKVPFLGSIPLLGRAFTTKSTETLRSELILAVTANRAR
jgi:type II secretory pathway component GspD/PulD (secretin)